MSRKITSFLMLLLALFVTNNSAKAQEDINLSQKSIAAGVALDSFEPNTWYFFHQGRETNGTGDYAPLTPGEDVTYGGYMTDQGEGKYMLKMPVTDVGEAILATNRAGYILRFIPTETEGVYNIQFGTGNYMGEPDGTGSSQKIKTVSSIFDAGLYAVYNIGDENAPGAFGINWWRNDAMQERIDNNGINSNSSANTIVTWGSGQHETAVNEDGMIVSNSIWSVVSVIWEDVQALDAAWAELNEIFAQYEPYKNSFPTGTDPGLYGEAEVAAFQAALNAAAEADTPDLKDTYTVEDLKKLGQNIIDTYNAVLASKVPMTLADGYYRIKTAMAYTVTTTDEETEETTTTEVDKYMFSATIDGTLQGRWGSPDYECLALWKLTNVEEGRFDLLNMATDARFNNVSRSTTITMSTTSTNQLVITPVATIDGKTLVNINVYPQNGGDGLFIHQNNHLGGSGAGSNLVGWYNTYSENNPGASEWIFLPVTDEEAKQIIDAYEPIKNREVMLEQYDEMLENAMANLEIAKDMKHVKLLTTGEQFSSPYSQNDHGDVDGGNLADKVLIDNNTNTYWHTVWTGGSVEGDLHYLQVDLIEPIDREVYASFSRRVGATNDHVTQMIIRGTNNPDAEKEDCEELLVWDTPFTSQYDSFTSDLFDTKNYQYLRFYANTTTNNRGYWHISELQVGYDIPNENAQINFMGDLATNLQTVIEAQADLERDDITIDEYNALKAAYDAFMAKFVDPTPLREALEDNKDVAGSIKIGTQPGFWAEGSDAANYGKLYEEAKAYDAKGDYTPEKSANYTEQLNEKAKTAFESAIGIKEGKWYRIRFASEDEYEEHNWDKNAGYAEGDEINEPLWDKYLTGAMYEAIEGSNKGEYLIVDAIANEIPMGENVYFDEDADISDKDLALWRFIAVGDTTYIMQNKGTNMFLKASGTSGAVRFSIHPSIFNVSAVGYGYNIIHARTIDGGNQNYLHAQKNHNTLVTWGDNTSGTASAFYIEEVEDVKADYAGTTFPMSLAGGSLGTYCFPVEVAVAKGEDAKMWAVTGLEGTQLTLAPIEKADAGRPFILVNGNTDDFDSTAEPELINFEHGFNVVSEPGSHNALLGVFNQTAVGAGVIIVSDNAFTVSKRSNTTVPANGAYIKPNGDISLTAKINVVWDAEGNGIEETLQNVSKSGAIYTIDGRLVSRKGNLNDLSRYGKGIYILNGVKVVIK